MPTVIDLDAELAKLTMLQNRTPQGIWHRFDAPQGVTMVTVTPQPTDHPPTHVEDPRALDAQPA